MQNNSSKPMIRPYDINTLDSVLLKPTQLVHITNTMSALDRRILNLLAKYAKKNYNRDEHIVPIEQIRIDLGTLAKDTSYIIDSIERLAHNEYTINILGKVRGLDKTIMSLLSYVRILNGNVIYSFPKKVAEAFASPKIYAKLRLEEQLSLKSKHSLALWEFFNEVLSSTKNDKIQNYFVHIWDFAKLIGITDHNSEIIPTYKDNYRLNALVKKAISHINQVTDLTITFRTDGKGKSFRGYYFDCSKATSILLKDNHPQQIKFLDDDIDLINNLDDATMAIEITSLIKSLELDNTMINQLEETLGSRKVLHILNKYSAIARVNGAYNKDYQLLQQLIEYTSSDTEVSLVTEAPALSSDPHYPNPAVHSDTDKNHQAYSQQNLFGEGETYDSKEVANALQKFEKRKSKGHIANPKAYLEAIIENDRRDKINTRKVTTTAKSTLHKQLKNFNTKPYLNHFIDSLEIVGKSNEILHFSTSTDMQNLISEFMKDRMKYIPIIRDVLKDSSIADFEITIK